MVPKLNLLRQPPAQVAQSLKVRMAEARGRHVLVVRPDGAVLEVRPNELSVADAPFQIGTYNGRVALPDLTGDLEAAKAALRR